MTSERNVGGHDGEHARECGMRNADLQRAFDSESGARNIASHVTGCDPCGNVLAVLQTQRDALSFLATTRAFEADDTAVGYILATSARAGRAKLADLLYEMSKACLTILPNFKRRVERRVEPRGTTVVAAELRAIASRASTTASGATVLHIPSGTVAEANALSVAGKCLTILENVEGSSERQCLAYSQFLIFSERPADAEALLRTLIESGRALIHRELADWNLMHSLMRQRRHAEAVEIGRAALLLRPSDGVVLFNLAASHACLRERDEFEAASAKLKSLLESSDHGAPEWLITLLRFEAPQFASCFDLSLDVVMRKFGLSGVEDR